jgi:hypothetical protein
MDLLRLKQAYREELVKVSVHPLKAEQTAKILSVEELKFIGDIWPEWGDVFTQIQQETKLPDVALPD